MKVRIVNRSRNALPLYQTPLSAGMDVRADLEQSVTLAPLGRAMIPTGLYVELPEGYEMQVRPRSGLAAKHGITVLNSPGTIDADYRGEIRIILVNLSSEAFTIEPGERIAQLGRLRLDGTVNISDGRNKRLIISKKNENSGRYVSVRAACGGCGVRAARRLRRHGIY